MIARLTFLPQILSDIRFPDIAQHFDPEHKISYDPIKEPKLYSEQLQWIFFVHGGVAPMYVYVKVS